MITISAFADEIAPDLKTQMDVCQSHGIKHIDVRAIDKINVSKFTLAQVAEYKKQMDDGGFRVACIGSPIGKIRVDEDFVAHGELLRHCCQVAQMFGTPYVRIFSFYPSPGRKIADQRKEVMDRLWALVETAGKFGITLLHENEKAIYGAKPDGVKEIFATVRSPNLKGIFDPANFVEEGIAPFDNGWTWGLDKLTHYFHIKDKSPGTDTCVPAGQGLGQFDKIFADLKARGWGGFMSLEPHMKAAGQFAGFTGADLFSKAVAGLKGLLDKYGMAYQ